MIGVLESPLHLPLERLQQLGRQRAGRGRPVPLVCRGAVLAGANLRELSCRSLRLRAPLRCSSSGDPHFTTPCALTHHHMLAALCEGNSEHCNAPLALSPVKDGSGFGSASRSIRRLARLLTFAWTWGLTSPARRSALWARFFTMACAVASAVESSWQSVASDDSPCGPNDQRRLQRRTQE